METIKLHFSKQTNIFCQRWFVFVFFQAKSPQNYTLNDIGIINPDRLRRYLCCFSHLTHVQAYSWGRAFDTNLTHEVRITKVSLPNVCEREGTDLENSADCRTLRAGQFAFRPALNFTSRRPKRNGRPLTPLALALRSRSRFARAVGGSIGPHVGGWPVVQKIQLAFKWAVGFAKWKYF